MPLLAAVDVQVPLSAGGPGVFLGRQRSRTDSLRKAAKRTTEGVCNALGEILDTLTSAECRNYFLNAGYEPF